MKTRLVYILIGALLALTLTFGALALRAQSDYAGQKWEYAWLDTHGADAFVANRNVTINGQTAPADFGGDSTFAIFDKLGSDGWNYVGRAGDYYLFKRLTQ